MKTGMVIESHYILCYFLQSNSAAQRRNLSLHECDSMGLLKSAGINVPAFRVATSKTEAVTAAADLGEIRCTSYNISHKCRSKKLIRLCHTSPDEDFHMKIHSQGFVF